MATMYFNHAPISTPLSPSNSSEILSHPPLKFMSSFVFNNSLSLIAVAHIHMDMGHPLEHDQPTGDHTAKET